MAAVQHHLERVAIYLKSRRDDDASLADVLALAEITAQSLQGLFESLDADMHRELRGIADYIAAVKAEIGALQLGEIKRTRIPAAGRELDAVVKATEAASNTIMECAEAVLAADADDPAAFKAMVEEKMLIVFEACAFQDIAGQRISKVLDTLAHIEARVVRLTQALRGADAGGTLNEHERAHAERRERLLLHGPQATADGNDQDAIDALFADALPAKA